MKATYLKSIVYTSNTKPYEWKPTTKTGFGKFKVVRAEAKWSRAGEGFGVEIVFTCDGTTYAQFFPTRALQGFLIPFGIDDTPASVNSHDWSTLVGRDAWGVLVQTRRGVQFASFSQEEPKVVKQ